MHALFQMETERVHTALGKGSAILTDCRWFEFGSDPSFLVPVSHGAASTDWLFGFEDEFRWTVHIILFDR